MILDNGGWFVVADGERYRIFQNHGTTTRPELRIVNQDAHGNPPNREQAADRPGRLADNVDARSAVHSTDWHTLEKTRFGEALVQRLNKWAESNQFEAVVVAADPRTLGTMRKAYSKKLETKIALEIPKDLTNESVKEITSSLLTNRSATN